MADYSGYNAAGAPGRPEHDPNAAYHSSQAPAPSYRPQGAPTPTGYMQAGSSYGGMQQQTPYGGAPSPAPYQQPQQPPYGQPQAQPPAPNAMDNLASQVGGLGIGGADAGAGRAHKKKNRHAYHDIGAGSAAAPGFNGMQAGGVADGSQFTQTGQPQSGFQSDQLRFTGTPQTPQTGFGAKIQSTTSPLRDEGVSAQGKVDPEQIPSVPAARDAATQYYSMNVYPTMEQHLPPPAAIPFVVHDQGNASPRFARLTVNSIPSTSEALASTGLPLGLILQPLAAPQEGELEVPVLDFGDAGPPRCRRCRTYINPFMMFKSGGNRFVCNMCNFPNEVAPEYFAPLDPSGIRTDRMQRPELMLGTVEFVVPKEYWAKEPVGLRWLFVIDVSQEAINKGFIDSVCAGVLNALYGEEPVEEVKDEQGEAVTPPGRLPAGSKIGIITFDKEIQFYNLSAQLDKAQMMVMTDLEEPFVPLSEGLFVDPYESKDVITNLLGQVPSLFAPNKKPEPCLLPALDAALLALAPTGGKIVASLSTLPTSGPGKLFMRDNKKGAGTDNEKKLYTTEHPGWRKTATKLVESGVGLDLFLGSSGSFMDVGTIGHASAISGGEVYYYPNFNSPRDTLKLSTELRHTVNRETGYQALMKVRCSNGLQVSSYHGNFLQHTFGADLEFGTIDADKAMGILFSYDGKLDSKLDAHFQAALLYTSASGQRRVRCINIVAGVTEGAMESMKFVDQDAVINIIAKEAASRVPDKSFKDIRFGLAEKTVDVLTAYRKNFSGSHPPGQLVLPENLKSFAMYMLGLIKCRAFKGGNEPTDYRSQSIRFLRAAGPTETSLYLYPRIYPIHNLDPGDCFPNAETGQLQVPPTMRASFAKVDDGGVYIVDNGQILLVWFHANVSPNLLEDLFGPGATSLKALSPATSSLPVLETHLNAQVRNLLQYISGPGVRGSRAATIQLARQGIDGSEFEFARMLVEDRNNEAQSYVDYLVHIHRMIALELQGRKGKDESASSTSTAGAAVEGVYNSLAGLRPHW